MQKAEAMDRLRGFEPRLHALGATSLFLFGSTARNEAAASSDIDLFLDIDPHARFTAFDLVAAKRMVEEELSVAVDLGTRDGLHPRLRDRILREAIQVF